VNLGERNRKATSKVSIVINIKKGTNTLKDGVYLTLPALRINLYP
jgi:hypothetical protein